MTRTMKIILTTGTVVAGLAVVAGSGLAGGWGKHHGRGDHGFRFFEAFDTDQNGRLTQAEIDDARRARFADFDGDGDGRLSLDEYQALWMDAMRERMVDRFQDLDDDGDAAVTKEEFVEPFGRVVMRLDRDDDNELTRADVRRRHRDHDHRRDRDR